MRLPERIGVPVDAALERYGLGTIDRLEPVGGGCISETARVRTTSGGDAFLKWSLRASSWGMFTAEARSLAALLETQTLRVPRVIAVAEGDDDGTADADGPGWLLLEWLDPGAATPLTWQQLGRGLAALHRTTGPAFGLPRDNFIGSLSQANGSMSSWPAFWRERRLRPQVELALAGGLLDGDALRRFDALFDRLDEILAPGMEDGPSLLHGDLWRGNLHVLRSGEPALIDPACYHGHREVDLAMTELFGGFDAAFHAAYREAWPLAPGYEPVRRAVYQLYYLLVHVNLFGGAYLAGTMAALRTTGF